MVRAHVTVKGKVQGVYFRVSTKKQAQIRGVTGWVKNTPDGSVEAVLEGEDSSVADLIAWCRSGPPAAVVDGVTVQWLPYSGDFHTFSIEG